jgi:hypothetical protein
LTVLLLRVESRWTSQRLLLTPGGHPPHPSSNLDSLRDCLQFSSVFFVGHFETAHCHTIFYVCRHFVPCIHHSLSVELLPYVQPRLSRRALHLKEGEWGVCTLILWSLETMLSCIDPSVKIVTNSPKVETSTYILHLSGFPIVHIFSVVTGSRYRIAIAPSVRTRAIGGGGGGFKEPDIQSTCNFF